ncbi:MAG: YceI family protein [Bacteroidia bacterium]|nr:YceI family protein [Bacteroidia bacterium]MBP9688518.1 YceI family protein [Bacteroidia bacterium]
MKKLLTFAAIAGLALSVVAISQPKSKTAATLKVDAQESSFKWTGKKVIGEHWGYVKFNDGTITVDGKKITGGNFTVNMPTITVEDIKGEYMEKLIGHLKSDDFFATDKFETSSLKIKALSPIAGAVAGQNNYNVVADLTIKNITKEIKFPSQIIVAADKVIANAEFEIDRTLFDIKYKGQADNLISDNFTVNVRVVAKK